jgi:hypothetical protein
MARVSEDRPIPIDDHGDQFPGAVPPARTSTRRPGSGDQFMRMHAADVQNVNSVVEADHRGLAHELAEAFVAEFSGAAAAQPDGGRRGPGRGTRSRRAGGRPPGQAGTRLGRFTRTSLRRFDRYTLDVFNPGAPYRPKPSDC